MNGHVYSSTPIYDVAMLAQCGVTGRAAEPRPFILSVIATNVGWGHLPVLWNVGWGLLPVICLGGEVAFIKPFSWTNCLIPTLNISPSTDTRSIYCVPKRPRQACGVMQQCVLQS
jgi:hypothetical protein